MKPRVKLILFILLCGFTACIPHPDDPPPAPPETPSWDTTDGYFIGDCMLADTVNPKTGFILVEKNRSSYSFAVIYLDLTQQGMNRFTKGSVRLVPRIFDNTRFGTECLSVMGAEDKKAFDAYFIRSGHLQLVKNIPEVLQNSYLPGYTRETVNSFIKQHSMSFSDDQVKMLPVDSMLETPGIADTLKDKAGK